VGARAGRVKERALQVNTQDEGFPLETTMVLAFNGLTGGTE
jgi:hypothetical protein